MHQSIWIHQIQSLWYFDILYVYMHQEYDADHTWNYYMWIHVGANLITCQTTNTLFLKVSDCQYICLIYVYIQNIKQNTNFKHVKVVLNNGIPSLRLKLLSPLKHIEG
jgi:hypothetical protein